MSVLDYCTTKYSSSSFEFLTDMLEFPFPNTHVTCPVSLTRLE